MVATDHSPAVGVATFWRCLAAGAALLLVTGCATPPVPPGSRFVVTAPKAQFFKNGPAQQISYIEPKLDQNINAEAVGPDFELPKGTQLTMVKREFGYSRLMTEDGVVGYVSNDQVAPAPAITRVSRLAAMPAGEPYRAPTRDLETPRKTKPAPRKVPEPALDLNDVPLPVR
jgi:hypothetical protein